MCGHGDPDGICVVSCDLGDAYPAGVRRNFGSAVVVYDRFHAVKLANEAMDDVVRRYMRDHKTLRGVRKKLMMNPSSLSADEYDRTMRLVSDFKDVSECYRLKNVLASIYDYGDREAASKVLDLWHEACIDSGIQDMARLAETIRSRREGILAWYDHPVSNGYAEGLNSLIQTTKRVARGYGNIENFIAMVYLRNGNLVIAFDRRPGDHPYASGASRTGRVDGAGGGAPETSPPYPSFYGIEPFSGLDIGHRTVRPSTRSGAGRTASEHYSNFG